MTLSDLWPTFQGHDNIQRQITRLVVSRATCVIYQMVPFPVTSSDPQPRFQGHGVIIDALNVLCAQLTRDLFAIAKFLFCLFRLVDYAGYTSAFCCTLKYTVSYRIV